MSINLQKNEIRKKLLQKRKTHDEYEFSHQNEVIIRDLRKLLDSLQQTINLEKGEINLEQARQKLNLAVYWSLKGEPDLLKLAINSSWAIALPKLYGLEMKMVGYSPGDPIEKSGFGELYQPASDIQVIPEVMIIPGLAFSSTGYRLGFGTGHYDRYMAKINQLSKIITIGVCFHNNLFEYLPYDEHDIKLNYIITNKILICL